ncbi:MAG: hypothetical protein NTY53_02670 [Kiritimatiellaeota bacterium]|nr:hypothetical protein [Kiritimatiellota bacterium]
MNDDLDFLFSDSTTNNDPDPVPSAAGGLVAAVFDGQGGYVEIPDSADYSQPTRGGLTVEAWLRPDSLAMPNVEGSGYAHWLGKGEPHQHEWVARMYQAGNSEGRFNRISFYAFNLMGGLGAGSYFQDLLTEGTWIYVVGRIDSMNTSIFSDGDQRDTDSLAGYGIVPEHGSAPVRIGTRDFQSFFHGAISRVAIYGAPLSADTIRDHYQARGSSGYDSLILGEPDLVGYWKLDEASGSVATDATGRNAGSYVGGVTLGTAMWNPA